jgi:hypothetical protein
MVETDPAWRVAQVSLLRPGPFAEKPEKRDQEGVKKLPTT